MAGHSKWANIKHKKMKEDARRGKVFTKMARLIAVAAREGGPDPASNFKLRLAIDKAKSLNVPNENIERAIKRGIGELEADAYEELVYEGYGPGGVAVLLQIMTDNRNRTAADVRHIFARHGGNLGESGCVAWMFEKKGEIRLPKSDVEEEGLMLTAIEAGADDVESDEESYIVVTDQESFSSVRQAIEEAGLPITSAELTLRPQNTVSVEGDEAKRLLALLDALEEHDDVQEVYANADISEESLEALQA